MRCPGCSKFPSFSTDEDPEVDIDIDHVEMEEGPPISNDSGSIRVTGNARIVLTSECCGEECKESSFDVEADIEFTRGADCKCDLTKTETWSVDQSPTITDRQETSITKVAKRGPNKGKPVTRAIPPRYQKRFYGVEVEITAKCECKNTTASETFKDETSASSMEEMG